MKKLRSGVNRANIEQDIAIYELENYKRYQIAAHIVRTSIYFLVNFGVLERLYFVRHGPDKH